MPETMRHEAMHASRSNNENARKQIIKRTGEHCLQEPQQTALHQITRLLLPTEATGHYLNRSNYLVQWFVTTLPASWQWITSFGALHELIDVCAVKEHMYLLLCASSPPVPCFIQVLTVAATSAAHQSAVIAGRHSYTCTAAATAY